MKKIIYSVFVLLLSLLFSWYSHAAINYTVTPINYELELNPGWSITLPASIKNNGDTTVTLPTWASDFQANGTGWVPSFVRRSELVFPDQQLSSWITISQSSVTIAPWEEATVDFTIDVPANATPGWHYGAVFFKNDGSETSAGGTIGINVDYGILVLVNVSGDIIIDAEIWDPSISWWGTWDHRKPPKAETGSWTWDWDSTNESEDWYIWTDEEWNPVYESPDNCPLWDFTVSKYDGSCFISPDPSDSTDTTGNNEPVLFNDEFEVIFSFPIKNKWNTHIKPNGKIVLKDEDGNIIKAIGKEVIANDRWAIIGEKIVDYIPINDQWGNILPQTERVFESEWKWFPYKVFDDEGNPIVQYWSPSEYYTQKNKDEAGFLMFWERVSESRTYKTITAEIEMVYYDEQWNPIEFSTAKEFPVQYIERVVSLNPYVILAIILLSTSLLFFYFGTRWWILVCKTKACWSCDEKIKSHWKTCPHCEALQDKKAQKEFEKNKKAQSKVAKKKAVPAKSRKAPARTKTTKK